MAGFRIGSWRVVGHAAVFLLATALPAIAEMGSVEECGPAIANNAEKAREDAAVWARGGGGVPARLCEAAALEAMGATGMAARLLTALAENPNRAMSSELRATVFEDAARLWLDEGQPEITLAALDSADRIAAGSLLRARLRARAEAAMGDWSAAAGTLRGALDEHPDDAIARALLAAALRRGGDPEGALVEAERALALDPDLAEARFEAGAALAETGAADAAAAQWMALIAEAPDHALAGPARRNLQALR